MIRDFANAPSLQDRYGVLLWDNSPEPLEDPPAFMLYQHDAENGGITGAFNGAAQYAQSNGYAWILLLDQDADLPPDFLQKMALEIAGVHGMQEVAAVVPTVHCRGTIMSPHRVFRNHHKPYAPVSPGIAPGECTAINSASALRVRDLLAVGGYTPDFQQEYSDWYIYHQLFLAGKKVWHASDIDVESEMTIMDYDNLLSTRRYVEFLAAEEAFIDLYRGSLEGHMQTARLMMRVVKQRLKWKNPEYSRLTFKRLLRRLVTSRRHRVNTWRNDLAARRARYTKGTSN
jgi:glycosyltransferase involved in cell wall biosynthesis